MFGLSIILNCGFDFKQAGLHSPNIRKVYYAKSGSTDCTSSYEIYCRFNKIIYSNLSA